MKPEVTPVPAGRPAEEGDWIARQLFTPDDLLLSPEEYAARHADGWGCFSFHLYAYRDAALGAWVRRVGEILADSEEVERCRRLYLSPEEMVAVRNRERERL